jgi:alpha-mannosidase
MTTAAKDYEISITRFTVFLRDVIEPAVYGDAAPLDVGVWQFQDVHAEPPTPAEAASQKYMKAPMGLRWGPKWSTAWFKLAGTVPKTMKGERVVLRFSSGTEAQLWVHEHDALVPRQGFDINRDAALLFDAAKGGEKVSLLVEAACNHPFGVSTFEWDDVEVHHRWKSDEPGRLERAELAVLRPQVWALRQAYAFALGLMKELPFDSNRGQELFAAIRFATNSIFDSDVPGTAPRALEVLSAALRSRAGGSTTLCHAVGHAHIDTAWLWPLRETKRKCVRSFSNVLRVMERYPDFYFLCSQAQQYAYIEEKSPELFKQIADRVAEGRWEPGGAMWIEPDANIISGESLVRQILHGERYWRSKFGERGKQHHVYLPDTFGFSAALPQIMKLAGLDTFITNKMSWNAVNTFPHTHFVWRGIDGSEVLAHCTPGHDYNASNTPKELRRGEANHKNKDLRADIGVVTDQPGVSAPARWLQPFGFGDGGGGPTDWTVEFATLSADCDGLPRVKLGRADEFCAALHADRAVLRARGEDFPSWVGELYLELHRGVLTTQAWIKEANRRAEEELRLAEALSFAAPAAASAPPRDKLDKAWKLLLLNQFHDIIPGSSIGWVYDDARRDMEHVRRTAHGITKKAIPAWCSAVGSDAENAIVVLNQCSQPRGGVVEIDDGELAFARPVPAMGVAVVDLDAPPGCVPVNVELLAGGGTRLSNGIITATIDDHGHVISLARVGGRDVCRAGEPMNTLTLFEDRPVMYDAWEIEHYAEQKPMPALGKAKAKPEVSRTPLRADITFTHTFGEASEITQIVRLDAGAESLHIRTHTDWNESRRLLRATFPTSILCERATSEIQFGHVQRPTHRNTSWDAARFESVAHRWVDLAEPGRGVSIINDCKYGHSAHNGTIGMSLLRSPVWPDEQADRGEHEFAYAIMPHDGDWFTAGVHTAAEAFNTPLRAIGQPAKAGPNRWSPFEIECEGAAGIQIDAVKLAEDDNRIIVRLHECRGGAGIASIKWSIGVSEVQSTDLLERGTGEPGTTHDAKASRTRIELRPFQIVTLAVTRS